MNGSTTMLARAAVFARRTATLFAIWVVLSGKLDALHLGIGAAAAAAVAAVYVPTRRDAPVAALALLTYVPWLLWQIVLSNLRVARVVLLEPSAIRPRLMTIEPGSEDERALALIGSSITLTPGTLTIDIDRERAVVHALDDASARDLAGGELARRVRRIFPGDER